MPSVGFEPAIPEIELSQVLHRTATGIVILLHYECKLRYKLVSLFLQRHFSTDERTGVSSGSKYTTAAEKLIESSLSCFEDRTLPAFRTTHTIIEKHAETMHVRTHQTGNVRIA